MQKNLKIAVAILVCSSMFYSCASDDKRDSRAPGGPPNSMRGEMGQSESELTLFRLKSLIDNAESIQSLSISVEQAAIIIPILEVWRDKLTANSMIDSKTFAANIAAVLTDVQNAYQPELSQGKPGGEGAPGKGPKPSGGPGSGDGESPVASLLDELIGALSVL